MTPAAKRQRANAALLPTARLIVDLYQSGVRGPTWQRAMAKLAVNVQLLERESDA